MQRARRTITADLFRNLTEMVQPTTDMNENAENAEMEVKKVWDFYKSFAACYFDHIFRNRKTYGMGHLKRFPFGMAQGILLYLLAQERRKAIEAKKKADLEK